MRVAGKVWDAMGEAMGAFSGATRNRESEEGHSACRAVMVLGPGRTDLQERPSSPCAPRQKPAHA
jgi:hypothetical protein